MENKQIELQGMCNSTQGKLQAAPKRALRGKKHVCVKYTAYAKKSKQQNDKSGNKKINKSFKINDAHLLTKIVEMKRMLNWDGDLDPQLFGIHRERDHNFHTQQGQGTKGSFFMSGVCDSHVCESVRPSPVLQAGVAPVNDRQLNETSHCSERLFDLLVVGQNLSGASQPGPQATVCIDSGGEGRMDGEVEVEVEVGGGGLVFFSRAPLSSSRDARELGERGM